jgi:hypothetical protein
MSGDSIWRLYSPFRSAINTQNFLLGCYQKEQLKEPEKRSYDNCYPFIYYLEHGQNFYQLAKSAPLSIKPILLFYGMVQLLKACLLTVDPQYPESTTVLAHGVSTRKRKKQNYEFLRDEVKIQKNGLFPHFSNKMFHVKNLEAEKYTMEGLFKTITEMNPIFSFSQNKTNHFLIGSIYDVEFKIPAQILDDLNMTYQRFLQFLEKQLPFPFNVPEKLEQGEQRINLKVPHIMLPSQCEPFRFHFYKQTYHFPRDREQFYLFPEVMVHYLILYNLSMICRYETEWWSDLLHSYSSVDYPFIQNFVELTEEKVPYLLFLYLNNKRGQANE